MSGTCGVMLRDRNRRLASGEMDAMARALGDSRHDDATSIAVGPVGLGACAFGRRVTGVRELRGHARKYALAFHGSLYGLDDIGDLQAGDGDLLTALLRLYVEKGLDCLGRLRGDFVFAVWDGAEETLHVATDRFRVHPVFFLEDREKFAFASRMAGLIACPLPITLTLNPEAVVDVVASSYVPTPKTVFREVRKLPPGYLVSHNGRDTRLTRYWDISFLNPHEARRADLERQLRTRFENAVATRFNVDRSSGQVGTFLSGGVDSSSVTAVLTRLSGRPVRSFSIGFCEEGYNEINYARIAARAMGVKHYERVVTAADVCDALSVLIDSFDEPFANASAIPTYLCARLAREHGVEVLYAGDGGDELFAGNERYAVQRLFEYYSRIPAWLRDWVLRPLVFALANGTGQRLLVRARKYIERASIPYPDRLSSYNFLRVFPGHELFEGGFLEGLSHDYDPYAITGVYYAEAPARTELDRQLYIDLKLAIADNDLFKVTRMTEAAGVTVRFPFLDHHLAEFASRVPAAVKMRGRRLRSFFKGAFADVLPVEVRRKRKHGFGLPIAMWLGRDERLRELMHELVLSPAALQRGYFRRSALEELLARHRVDGTSFYGGVLWNLMMLELWHRAWLPRVGARLARSAAT